MRSSDEQLKAINISGGATLSAGAGAGKTYVIIEHFISSLRSELDSFLNNENLEDNIKEALRGYVIITFTKKAAKELGDRIDKRIIFR